MWICWRVGSPTPSRMLPLLHLPQCSRSLLLPETSQPPKAAWAAGQLTRNLPQGKSQPAPGKASYSQGEEGTSGEQGPSVLTSVHCRLYQQSS